MLHGSFFTHIFPFFFKWPSWGSVKKVCTSSLKMLCQSQRSFFGENCSTDLCWMMNCFSKGNKWMTSDPSTIEKSPSVCHNSLVRVDPPPYFLLHIFSFPLHYLIHPQNIYSNDTDLLGQRPSTNALWPQLSLWRTLLLLFSAKNSWDPLANQTPRFQTSAALYLS